MGIYWLDVESIMRRENFVLTNLRRQIFEQVPLLAFAALHTTFSSLALIFYGFPAQPFFFERLVTFGTNLGAGMLALVAMQFFKMAAYDRSDRPLVALFRSVASIFTNGRCVAGFCVIAVTNTFLFNFLVMKRAIPWFNPFSWDATFDKWDTAIHFGYRPWEILQPVLAYGPITRILDFNYYMWGWLLIIYVLHFAFFEQNNHNRNRGILAYMLVWTVGGTLLATVFSSAGPCYFQYLGLGYDPYRGLMQYLASVDQNYPLITSGIQADLWDGYLKQNADAMSMGVSAMPSMHNAQAFLLVLVAWNKGRLVRGLAITYCALIFVASVHLGWHYAVDAYLAYVIAGVAWPVADWLARKWENRLGMPEGAIAATR